MNPLAGRDSGSASIVVPHLLLDNCRRVRERILSTAVRLTRLSSEIRNLGLHRPRRSVSRGTSPESHLRVLAGRRTMRIKI